MATQKEITQKEFNDIASILAGVNFDEPKKKVVTKKKVVVKEVKADCPPCPDCPPTQVLHIDTLKVKDAGDVLVSPNKKTTTSNNSNVYKNWLMGSNCKIKTPQEILQGRYAIAPIKDLITSNDPTSYFSINPNYPAKCQERDYKQGSYQYDVMQGAKNLDPDLLLSDNPTASDGPMIVNESGVVLGGNSRTMMLILAINKYPKNYENYNNTLLKKCSYFGIEASKIANIINPVLVRIIGDSGNQCSYYSKILNQSLTKELNIVDESVSSARQIPKEYLIQLGQAIEGDLSNKNDDITLKEIINNKKVQEVLIMILKSIRVITNHNVETYIKHNLFTEQGERIVEAILLAVILDDKFHIEAVKDRKLTIARNYFYFIKMKNYPKKWDIIPHFKKAIEFEYNARMEGKGIKVKDQYKQRAIDTEYEMDRITYLTQELFEIKSSKKAGEVLRQYCIIADNEIGNSFYKTGATPDEVLEKALSGEGVKLLANLGDKDLFYSPKPDTAKKNNKGFPCTISFIIEETTLKKKKVTIFTCKARNEKGMSIEEGWNINPAWIKQNIATSLRDFLIKNGYLTARDIRSIYSTMEIIVDKINKKYKTSFKAELEVKNDTYILKNVNCEYDKEYVDKKYYMPAMFDGGNKQTLWNKITNWLKKDLEKKYRWQK